MAKLLTPVFSSKFKKQYKRLPKSIQKKFTKQLNLLIKDYRYPSLRTKKMASKLSEARMDLHYRFTFEIKEKIEENDVIFRIIGPHDEGLGKK